MKAKKLVSMLLTSAMTAGLLIGCGNTDPVVSSQSSETTQKETAQESSVVSTETKDIYDFDEIKKLTFYSYSSSLESGVKGGYMKDLFASRGLEVEVWAFSDEKTNAILASGDMPDIMCVKHDQLETMIEAGMVLELDEYLDAMPHVQSLDGLETAISYTREFASNGTGKVYGLPLAVGAGNSDGSTDRYCLRLFWDYYAEVGMPEFNSLQELIPILKEMQKNHPTDAVGNKVYAVGSYYNPTDLNMLFGYGHLFGYDARIYQNYCVAADMVNGELEYLLDKDGLLYECLDWFNQLYREGLLDPDSINMDRTTQQTKVQKNAQNGTYIVGLADAPGAKGRYMPIYFEGNKSYYPNYTTYGNGTYIVVNAETKNVDACLRLLDMFSNPDDYLVWRFGPQGEKWDIKDGNVVYLTDKYQESLKTGEKFVYSTGEEPSLWNTVPICTLGAMTSFVDENGNSLPVAQNVWPEYVAIQNADEIRGAWADFVGYETQIDMMKDKGALYKDSRLRDADKFLAEPTDQQKLVSSAVLDCMVQNAWKMIYAETDADFEKIWDTMVKDAEGMGAKDLFDWCVKSVEEAVAVKESLAAK